jgi:Rrf2 family transcriptional regulator, iron-sulfur cluster assembly transcription factor
LVIDFNAINDYNKIWKTRILVIIRYKSPVYGLVAMIFTNTTEYAIRGLSELGCRPQDRCVMLDDLLTDTDLPRDFMAKIFQRLVHAGILNSVKGRNGGFSLARPPHEITLRQIVEVLEGPQVFDNCVVGMSACNDQTPCPQHDLYKPIRQRLKDYLSTTTVADLASSLRAKKAWLKNRPGSDDAAAPTFLREGN